MSLIEGSNFPGSQSLGLLDSRTSQLAAGTYTSKELLTYTSRVDRLLPQALTSWFSGA